VRRTAVVVGAGIGGLAAAGALARTGWSVTVLERDERSRPGRAALVLWPNGLRALHTLRLGAGVDGIATPLASPGIRRADGRWLQKPSSAPDGVAPSEPGRAVVVHPADLHDILMAGLGDRVDFRTGIDVRTVRPGSPGGRGPAVSDGVVTFEADLVVAADGASSGVRRTLAPGSTFVTAGHAAWRAFLPAYRAPALPSGAPRGGEVFGAGHRFSYAALDERGAAGGTSPGGLYWVATAPGAARPEPAQTQLALLRRWFAGWPAPLEEILAATEPGDLVQDVVGEVAPLPATFSYQAGTGGYVLLGDAAHAMTHHLGQGGCLALEDAATLQAVMANAVPGTTLATALAEYTALRRSRVARVLGQSRRVGSLLQSRGRLAVLARDAMLGQLTPRLLSRASAAASDWRPPAGVVPRRDR